MDAEYANYYTREVMLILIREFQSPDEEMKKIVLKVFVKCSYFYLFLTSICYRLSNNVVEQMVWNHSIFVKIFYLISLDISGITEWLLIDEIIDKYILPILYNLIVCCMSLNDYYKCLLLFSWLILLWK